jgi:uncharacterized membrane protein
MCTALGPSFRLSYGSLRNIVQPRGPHRTIWAAIHRHEEGHVNPTNRIPSLADLKALRHPPRNANTTYEQSLKPLERVAVWITDHVGSMGFFLIIFVWTMSWLAWNALGPKNARFDPSPAFVLWLFLSNMIQIFLMPLIMVGQNLQSRHAEARAESDYEVNVRAEQEIEAILTHLEAQTTNIEKILAAMERQPPA